MSCIMFKVLTEGLTLAQRKMRAAGTDEIAIAAFANAYKRLQAGESGLIHESDIAPLDDVPRLHGLKTDLPDARAALSDTIVIKLNGGLGTSMGLHGPKSLLPVRRKGDRMLRFLDIIAGQILSARRRLSVQLPILFMDSFATSAPTREALQAYPELAVEGMPMELLQNREPKLDVRTLAPVAWARDPSLEWCPPGHGDLYTSLYASGMLERIMDAGYRYATISNCDNIGAAPSPTLAGYFARSGAPYMAEVCRKTPADVKGGQLVRRRSDGHLLLRETAQTAPEDVSAALDASVHPFFHTNNLWIRLDALRDLLDSRRGVIGLPLVRNVKTVDPTDRRSTKVIQLESAMGAAIGEFDGAIAVEVDRSRFIPVKKTNDLIVVRSDRFSIDSTYRLQGRTYEFPKVDLDPDHYALIDDFERRFPAGVPSLVHAHSWRLRGDWTFGRGVVVRGDAQVDDPGEPRSIPDGSVLDEAGVHASESSGTV